MQATAAVLPRRLDAAARPCLLVHTQGILEMQLKHALAAPSPAALRGTRQRSSSALPLESKVIWRTGSASPPSPFRSASGSAQGVTACRDVLGASSRICEGGMHIICGNGV